MSSKLNRRAKGDKGPAKSSQSIEFISSLSGIEGVNMDLLNGVSINIPSTPTPTESFSQCPVYFGSNASYRTQLKLLSKKSDVTRQKALKDIATIAHLATKEELVEMLPSFCYYYNELLYCQSFIVRMEVNKILMIIGAALGKDIGKYVKHFIVSLQVYMSDTNPSVGLYCRDLFSTIIPEEKQQSVSRKYYEETVLFADSLMRVDAAFLDDHHQEAESIDESIDRLHKTSQLLLTTLLQKPYDLTPTIIAVCEKQLQLCVESIIDYGSIIPLKLLLEICNSISWDALFQEKKKEKEAFCRQCQKLLFEKSGKVNTLYMGYCNTIVASWITLTVKYPAIYSTLREEVFIKSFIKMFAQYDVRLQVVSEQFDFVFRALRESVFPYCSMSFEAFLHEVYTQFCLCVQSSPEYITLSSTVYLSILKMVWKEDMSVSTKNDYLSILSYYLSHLSLSILPNISNVFGLLLPSSSFALSLLLEHVHFVLSDVQRTDDEIQVKFIKEVLPYCEAALEKEMRKSIEAIMNVYVQNGIRDVNIVKRIMMKLECMITIDEGMKDSICTCLLNNIDLILSVLISSYQEETYARTFMPTYQEVISLLSQLQSSTSFSSLFSRVYTSFAVFTRNQYAFLVSYLVPLSASVVLASMVKETDCEDVNHLSSIIHVCSEHHEYSLFSKVIKNIEKYDTNFLLELIEDPEMKRSEIMKKEEAVIIQRLLNMSIENHEAMNKICYVLEGYINEDEQAIIVTLITSRIQKDISENEMKSLIRLLHLVSSAPAFNQLYAYIQQDQYWRLFISILTSYNTLLPVVNTIRLLSPSSFSLSLYSSCIFLALTTYSQQHYDIEKEIVIRKEDTGAIIEAFITFSSLSSPSSLYHNVVLICKQLLIHSIDTKTIDLYWMNENTPTALLRKAVKSIMKKTKENSTKGTEMVKLWLREIVDDLKNTKSESIDRVCALLEHCSCYFNCYTTIDEEIKTSIIPLLACLTRHFQDYSTKAAGSVLSALPLAQLLSLSSSVSFFTLSLLSSYALNEDSIDLYEGNLWNLILILTSMSIKNHTSSVIRLMKYMTRIKSINQFTIPEEIYGNLSLICNSHCVQYIKHYLSLHENTREREMIIRMYTGLESIECVTRIDLMSEMLKEFLESSSTTHLEDITLLLLLFLKKYEDVHSMVIQLQSCIEAFFSRLEYNKEHGMLLLLVLLQVVYIYQLQETLPRLKREEEEEDVEVRVDCPLVDEIINWMYMKNVFRDLLIHIISCIPYTSQSTKSRPRFPDLTLPLLHLHCSEALPIYTYYRLCCILPRMVQSMFIQDSASISKSLILSFIAYTTYYITPTVLVAPLHDIQQLFKKYGLDDAKVALSGNMYKLTLTSGVTEIKTSFAVDEKYPLNVTIIIKDETGFLTASNIERWNVLLRSRCMSNKNIGVSIAMIAKSILNTIDRVEPCPICYCTLQPNTHALPDRPCSQCVGIFHHECLNKWFITSNSHNCPLCRQQMII